MEGESTLSGSEAQSEQTLSVTAPFGRMSQSADGIKAAAAPDDAKPGEHHEQAEWWAGRAEPTWETGMTCDRSKRPINLRYLPSPSQFSLGCLPGGRALEQEATAYQD